MIVTAIIFLAVLPAVTWLSIQVHGANKAFHTFGNALVAKDYARAYKLTSSEFQATVSESTFSSQQAGLVGELGDLKQVTEDSFDTKDLKDGWWSEITATFAFKQADRHFDIRMRKQGSEWRVYGYREW